MKAPLGDPTVVDVVELVELLVEVVELVLVDVVELVDVLVEVVELVDVDVLLEVVVLVDVVGGPLVQSASEAAMAPLAMNLPGSSFMMVAASKRAQLRIVPVVMRTTTSPSVPASGTPVSLPTIFTTFVSFKTTTLIGTGPPGASLLTYL